MREYSLHRQDYLDEIERLRTENKRFRDAIEKALKIMKDNDAPAHVPDFEGTIKIYYIIEQALF